MAGLRLTLVVLAALLGINITASAQQVTPEVREMAMKAIKLMDEGKIKESITILDECLRLAPNSALITYELGYAHYLAGDYQKTIELIEPLLPSPDATDQFYSMVGNAYDIVNNPTKAIETYKSGLVRYPKSGRLYLEMANVHLARKDYDKAVPLYERGIEVEPTFPSNYYRIAQLYCNSNNTLWGVLYGELFMHLDKRTKRSDEISNLLLDTYKRSIAINGDSAKISFCKIVVNEKEFAALLKNRLPFCMVFEGSLITAVLDAKTVNVETLTRMRTSFIRNYYKSGYDTTHPNILFSYHRTMIDAGQFEAYNRWLFMKADEDGFKEWKSANEKKWTDFVAWKVNNPLVISEESSLYVRQYEE